MVKNLEKQWFHKNQLAVIYKSVFTKIKDIKDFFHKYKQICSFLQIITHFWLSLPIYTPRKHQKISGFLIFSDGFKWEHWSAMGSWKNFVFCDSDNFALLDPEHEIILIKKIIHSCTTFSEKITFLCL